MFIIETKWYCPQNKMFYASTLSVCFDLFPWTLALEQSSLFSIFLVWWFKCQLCSISYKFVMTKYFTLSRINKTSKSSLRWHFVILIEYYYLRLLPISNLSAANHSSINQSNRLSCLRSNLQNSTIVTMLSEPRRLIMSAVHKPCDCLFKY